MQKGRSAKSSKISKGKASQRNQMTNSKKDTKQNIKSKKSKVKIEQVDKLEAKDDLREVAMVEQKELKQDIPLSKRRRSDRKCSNVSENANNFKESYDKDSISDVSDDDEEWTEVADGKKKNSMKKNSRRNKTDIKSLVKDENM